MKKAHPLNRRDFLKSGLASLGFLATDGLPVFAVSPNWNPKKKPNLIIKKEMERIWGEPYDDVWHKTVKGYHFFGFGWPAWPDEMGLSVAEHLPYKGWLYNDTKDEGMSGCAYHHYSLHFTELVRRELEARRLDPKKTVLLCDACLLRQKDETCPLCVETGAGAQ